MRIGIDATPLPPRPGGAGNYIIQLIRALLSSETEHQFIIFTQKSGRRWFSETSAARTEWALTADKPPALRLIWEQTVLPWLARRYQIDILHSLHYTRPIYLPCASIVTFHDLTFFSFPELHTPIKRVFFPRMMRLSARRADALLVPSESTYRDAMQILKIPTEKITVIPMGIGSEFRPLDDRTLLEQYRQQYHLPTQFILYTGAIEPRKNLPLLLRAYARVSRSKGNVSLVITGGLGWMYKEVFQQIEALGLQKKVQFTGYIPAQDLPIVYNLAQIFVYPSLYEGFGFPPLEAMACGTPTITTAISAMLEHVGDGALLVPPQDETALAETMLKVLDNPKLHQEISLRGCQQAAKFTWSQTAQATLKVYQQVIMSH